MAWIDYLVIAIIVFSSFISIMRGFIRESLALGAWVISIWIAVTYADNLSPHLMPLVSSESLSIGIAVLILLLSSLLVVSIINFLLSLLFFRGQVRTIDRILGLGFGVMRGILIISMFMLIASYIQMTTQPWYLESTLLPYFSPISEWLHQIIQSQLPLPAKTP